LHRPVALKTNRFAWEVSGQSHGCLPFEIGSILEIEPI
jgi:hypothetical protein